VAEDDVAGLLAEIERLRNVLAESERKAWSYRLRIERQRDLLRSADLWAKENPFVDDEPRRGRPLAKPPELEVAKKIVEYRAQGRGPNKIAKMLKSNGFPWVSEHQVRSFVRYHKL
jgi:hypothetical protein